MSILVPFNGVNYIIPTPGETGWGSNLDSFFVAIGAGCLQKIGGSFLLANEVDFGASFGLKSLYYKSESANIASTGNVRLANAIDTISWRNAANNGNLALTVNSSNQLTFNGVPIESDILTSAHILVGNASNIATDVAMSGDVFIDNTGLTTIQPGVVTSAKIASQTIVNSNISLSAAIAYSKLALTNSIVNADINSAAAIAYSKLALTNSIVNADVNSAAAIVYSKLSLTNSIVNADIATSAAIVYSKLNLALSIVNGDISATAAIAYSKLNLSNSIVNADINTAAGIVYSKLNLTGGIVNADVNAAAAIAYSKLNLALSIVNGDIATSAAIAYSKLNLSNSIVNADINTAAAIAYSKLNLSASIVNADIATAAAIVRSKLASTETTDVTYASGKGIFWTDNTTNTIKITAPASVTTYTMTWPSAQGGSNQYLTNNGSGVLSWTNAAGTGTVNTGTTPQLAYYASSTNAVSTVPDLYYDSTHHALSINSSSGAAGINLYVHDNGADAAIKAETTQTNSTAYLAVKNSDGTQHEIGCESSSNSGGGRWTGVPADGMAIVSATGAYFTTNGGTLALTLDTSQNVLIGATTARTLAGLIPTLQVEELGATAAMSIVRNSATGTGPLILLGKSRGTTNGAVTIVQSGDTVGTVRFNGADGTDIVEAAEIRTQVDGTPGAGSMPGRIIFATSASGSTTPTEALRLDSSQNASFAGTVTVTGKATLSNTSGNSIHGTNTNDNATAGDVGQTVSSFVAAQNFPTSTQYGDITSISLTAGDWLVTGVFQFNAAGSTTTAASIGISTTTGNSTTGLTIGDNNFTFSDPTGVTALASTPFSVPAYRLSLSTTTTVYLKFEAVYSAGTPQASGRISAVRIR